MLKAVLAVIAGYVAMAAIIFVVFTGLYSAMGPDRAFQPGTYEVSGLWLVASFSVSLVAAILGGVVARRISGPGAARALAALVVVLGLVMAWPVLNPSADTRPTVRSAGTPNLEAMQNARQPAWVSLTIPLVGAVGVLIGGSRGRR